MMRDLKKIAFLDLLKDSMKAGVLLTNYSKYNLTKEDIADFVEGREVKLLCGNSTERTVNLIKEAISNAGIDISDRETSYKMTRDALGFRFDYGVELTDAEFDKISEEYDKLLEAGDKSRK